MRIEMRVQWAWMLPLVLRMYRSDLASSTRIEVTFLPSPSGGTMEADGCKLSTPMLFVPKVLFLKRWHRGKPDRG
jgi:hypothetical protein